MGSEKPKKRQRSSQDGPAAGRAGSVTFSTGAKRSEVQPFYSAIPAASLRRLALRATGAPKGATHVDPRTGFSYHGGSLGYGYGNWAKGLPMRDTFNHIIEHLYEWKEAVERGDTVIDDHLAAAAWGILMPLMTFEREYVSNPAKR